MQAGDNQHHREEQDEGCEVDALDCGPGIEDAEDEHQHGADDGHCRAIDPGARQAAYGEDEITGKEDRPGNDDMPTGERMANSRGHCRSLLPFLTAVPSEMLVVRDWKQNQAACLYLQFPKRCIPFTTRSIPVPFRAVLLLLAIAIGFSSAAAQHAKAGPNAKPAPAITLTEQDNGRDIDLNAGETLIVRLPSNPSTGYNWIVAGEPSPLELQKSTFQKKSSNS